MRLLTATKIILSLLTVLFVHSGHAVADANPYPLKTTIVVNAPKSNQSFVPGSALTISGHLYRTIRQPYINVSLYESSSLTNWKQGKLLSLQHIKENGPDGGFSGKFKIPHFALQKGEYYTLVFHQTLPGAEAVAVPLHPLALPKSVPVTIEPHCGNLKLSEAIKDWLEKYSDPTLFKSITIVKVAKDQNGPLGKTEWTVTLVVHHQLGKTSAYDEGLNTRIVGFTEKNGSYRINSLATGG